MLLIGNILQLIVNMSKDTSSLHIYIASYWFWITYYYEFSFSSEKDSYMWLALDIFLESCSMPEWLDTR